VVVKFVQPWQVLKFKNPAGTKVMVLVADVYPGADAVSVTVPVELPRFCTYSGMLLEDAPAFTGRTTVPVPRTVGLVDNTTLVASPLVTVMLVAVGAAVPRVAPIAVCKS